jgi:hypothetical protein
MMRFAKRSKRRIARVKFDARWLFPIVLIVIAGLLAFSAEIWERLAARSAPVGPSTLVSKGH